MSISPIASQPVIPVQTIASPMSAGASDKAAGVGGFGEMLEGVAASLNEAQTLSNQLATGELTDIHQLTAAAAKAELNMQLTVAFRDKAVDAFQQIMQMQI